MDTRINTDFEYIGFCCEETWPIFCDTEIERNHTNWPDMNPKGIEESQVSFQEISVWLVNMEISRQGKVFIIEESEQIRNLRYILEQ